MKLLNFWGNVKMEFKKYKQDAVNGKWYEVQEEGFTNEEWEAFQRRWHQGEKMVKKFTKTECFMILFALLAVEAKILGIW